MSERLRAISQHIGILPVGAFKRPNLQHVQRRYVKVYKVNVFYVRD